ncbi:MAG TPA: type III pantothenate kinase [Salegentibacter sp.]|uniref:type III pantothenate kinase n=1 Tax=Salegentibacter sp. TaxID=1903072 RepID=UPI002F9308BA
MNLVVDIGNTLVKMAVFQNASLQYKVAVAGKDFFQKTKEIFKSFPNIEYSILSSVIKNTEREEKFLEERSELVILTMDIKQPFTNHYVTPSTLGKDRIALIAAAVKNYPGKNVLVIDAGSCITYDFKNKKEEYLGGAISPGLAMRFRAMHEFTGNLPLFKAAENQLVTGNSTQKAMNSGAVNGVVFEIDGFINSYKSENKDLTIILTGGDMLFLSKQLKNSIFANPNFLFEGLNYILEFNKTQ